MYLKNYNLKNKVAVVTGAGKGLGKACAIALAEAGANLIIISRTQKDLNQVSKIIKKFRVKCTSYVCDVTNYHEIKSIINKVKRIDVLINNAGFLVNKSFEDTTLDDFHNIYSTNVFSVAMLIKRTIKYMHEGSNVINISSIGGVQGSVKFPGLSAYSSSKGALNILTEMLAEEYKEKKVHFNSLALGSVQTKMLEKAFPGFKASTSSENMAKYIYNFATEGYKLMNGKVVSISSTTP